MKLIYNPGGFSATRQLQRYDSGRTNLRHRYTQAEKLAILEVLDRLMIDEGMTQQRAGAVLKVDPACLTRWAKKKDDFIANPKANTLSHNAGPSGIFDLIHMLAQESTRNGKCDRT